MELFGISGSEFLVLVILAVLVAGPKGAVQALALLKKGLASFREWNARLRRETSLGDLAADLNLGPGGLDLSQYDPRALVRQTVKEEMEAWARQADSSPPAGQGVASRAIPRPPGAAAKDEATADAVSTSPSPANPVVAAGSEAAVGAAAPDSNATHSTIATDSTGRAVAASQTEGMS